MDLSIGSQTLCISELKRTHAIGMICESSVILDWPFGAVVYEAELMARDYPCGPIPLETNAAVGQSPTALLELLLLLCFSTLCAFV